MAEPWCAVWRNASGERGLRVSLGWGWIWLSKQQAELLLVELRAALVRLGKREQKHG